jgi:hypothetical protein
MSTGRNRLVQKRLKLKRRSYDGVTDEQIYDRDNWQCQLPECLHPEDEGGRAIDPALRGTNGLWTPAIHHIKPLSAGGLSNAANKQAAHSRCSSMANRDAQMAAARISTDPEPGAVQVRLLGLPDDIDSALAVLAAAGEWKMASRSLSPDKARHPAEKVIGLLTPRPGAREENSHD